MGEEEECYEIPETVCKAEEHTGYHFGSGYARYKRSPSYTDKDSCVTTYKTHCLPADSKFAKVKREAALRSKRDAGVAATAGGLAGLSGLGAGGGLAGLTGLSSLGLGGLGAAGGLGLAGAGALKVGLLHKKSKLGLLGLLGLL